MKGFHFVLFLGMSMSVAACSDNGVDCGEGTTDQDGQCVPAPTAVTCGEGTTAVGGTCTPNVVCGDGTTAKDGKCVPTTASITCGDGTTAKDGKCVPTATGFLVRTPDTNVVADGKTKVSVFAIGTFISVRNGPGQMAFTLMLKGASSRARARVIWTTAPLLEA